MANEISFCSAKTSCSRFDIHFRIIEATTSGVPVLQSGCYEYAISL